MKKPTFFLAGIVFAIIFLFSFDTQKADAQLNGFWAMADRYDRYPCAGSPTDCFVIIDVIIVTPDE